MRAADRLSGLLLAVAAVSACDDGTQGPGSNDVSAPAEIETLPPDESLATPTDELVNGGQETDTNDTVDSL